MSRTKTTRQIFLTPSGVVYVMYGNFSKHRLVTSMRMYGKPLHLLQFPKMKFLIALALIAVVVARPGDFYDAKFDNINIDEIIENERLFKNYVDCMVGTGKCTSEGEDIKGKLIFKYFLFVCKL